MDISSYRAKYPPKEHEEAVRMLLEGLDRQELEADLKEVKSTNTTVPKTASNVNKTRIQDKITPKTRRSRPTRESSDSFEEQSAASLTTRSSSSTGGAGSSSRAGSYANRPDEEEEYDDDLLNRSRSSLSQDFIEMSPREERKNQSRLESRGDNERANSRFVPRMQSKATSTPASDSFSTSGGGSLSGSATGIETGAAGGLGAMMNANDDENNNYEAIPNRTVAVQCDLKASSVKRDGYFVETATDLASMQASSISSTRYGFYKLSPEAMEERRQLARSTSSRNIGQCLSSSSASSSSGSRRRVIGQMNSPTSMSEFSSVCKSIDGDNDSYADSPITRKRRAAEETVRRQTVRSRTSTPAACLNESRPASRLDSLPRRPKTALSYVSMSRLRDDRSASSSPDRTPSCDSGHRLMRARAVSQQVLSGSRGPTPAGDLPLYSDHSDASDTLATTRIDRYRVPCKEEVLVSSTKRLNQVGGVGVSSRHHHHHHQQQQVRNNERQHRSYNAARSQILAERATGPDDDQDHRYNHQHEHHDLDDAHKLRRNNETFKRSATISNSNANRYTNNAGQQMANEIINEKVAGHEERQRHHHYQDDSLNQFNTENMSALSSRQTNGQLRSSSNMTNVNRITNEPKSRQQQQPVRYGSMSLSRKQAPVLIDRSCNNLSQLSVGGAGGHHNHSNKQRRTSTGASSELVEGATKRATNIGADLSNLTRATASRQQALKQQQLSDICCDLEPSRNRTTQQSSPIGRSTSMRQVPSSNSFRSRENRAAFDEAATTNYRHSNRDVDYDDEDEDDDDYGRDIVQETRSRHLQPNGYQTQHIEEVGGDGRGSVLVVESDDSGSPMTKTWANPSSSKAARQISPSHQNLAPTSHKMATNKKNRRSHSMRDVSGSELRNVGVVDEPVGLNQQSHGYNTDDQEQEHVHHYQAKQFQYNWESASDELSSLENNPQVAQQLFSRAAAAQQNQLDYDSQHRLNESGLPETNPLDSSSSSSPKLHHKTPASCLGLSSSGKQQPLTRQQQQHQQRQLNGNLNGSQRNNGFATTGRQPMAAATGLAKSGTITGRAMSQQSLVRPTMPLSSGRRLRRQNNASGSSSGGGSELGGSSLSLMSSRYLAGSRYENAHTRSPVVMYIPQANSKPGSMSDLNGTGRTRRSSRSRLTKSGSASQDNMRRKSSLSRHGSDNESQSSMLRTLVKPKGSRSSVNGFNHYASKRSSRLRRKTGEENSNGEDEDMDGVGQLASEMDSYKFRRRYSVPKDAKINWFAKLRQRVISSK